ncbi:oxidoreductase [Hypomontagnella monticulosa]|nr:oxidoreductase [Hypomontagnella monticulosa]
MTSVLIIGASRGLGAALVKEYSSDPKTLVFATTRSETAPSGFPNSVKWLSNVDLTDEGVGQNISNQLGGQKPLDVVIVNAGLFIKEDFSQSSGGPLWDDALAMYTTSCVAPTRILHRLVHNDLLKSGSKIVLVSSEAGSLTLRHEKEGGGNYTHHASKAALNMIGKLLSIDLKERGIIVSIIHPGFMRTEMTRSVGFDAHWDAGGAVTPEVAAKSLVEWTEKLDISKSGEYWAPRGPRDIGMAETVLGKNLETPLKLPW